MIDRELPYQDIRAVLSMCAALCAFLLCHTLRHFTVALAHPSTWYVATHHRCGWVLIATFHMVSLRNDQLLLPERHIVATA
jgi:hypothetical protein